MPDQVQQRVIVAATLSIALVYLCGTALSSGLREPVVQGDARSYFAYLPSIVLDGDLDLTNQFAVLRPEEVEDPRYPFGVGANGYAANPFPIGPALLWLPGYLIGLGIDGAAGAAGWDTGTFGYGLFAGWGAALAAIFWVGVGAELARRLARDVVATRYALPATLLVWVGTPALYYSMIAPLYSHAVALFAAALVGWLSWTAFRHGEDTWRWLAAGAAGGLLVAIRLQDAPVLLVALGLAVVATRRLPAMARALAAMAAGGLLGYLPQAYAWYALHGEILPRQGLGQPKAFSLSRLLEILFSTGYEGWLSWSPLAAVALVGFVLIVRGPFPAAERNVAMSSLCAIAGLLLIDVIHPYGQGAAFGARRYVTVTPLLVVGIAGAIAWCVSNPRLERAGPLLIAALALAEVWLLLAYELLILRHGVYADLATAWSYAIGLWSP